MGISKILRITVPAFVATLLGCATGHEQPYLAYSDVGQRLADTTVFSAYGVGSIRMVDNVPIPRLWVRVLPGSHTFRVAVRTSSEFTPQGKEMEGDLTIPDMLPGHVYTVEIKEINPYNVHFRAKDLGYHPPYGITVGPNRKPSIVTFSE